MEPIAQPDGDEVRIVVVDDHPAVRAGLERLLQREPGFRVVAALEGPAELQRLLARAPVDVVVLDVELARGDGLAACQRLKQRPDAPAVLVYSAHAGPALVVPVAVAQADALVGKAEPVHALLDALRRAAQGERLVAPPTPDLLAAASARVDATDAPLVPLLVDGATVAEIGAALSLDDREVRRRCRRLLGRLCSGSRRAAHPRCSHDRMAAGGARRDPRGTAHLPFPRPQEAS